MRKKLFFFVIGIAATVVRAAVDMSLSDAYLNGADAKILYRVVNDEGDPVANANVHIWFRTTHPN